MKKILLIALVVVVLGGIVFANLNKSKGTTVKARTAKVELGTIVATVSAPGNLRAVTSVDISAEVPGRVVELHVAEGDSVAEGDLLLKLDDAQYTSRVAQADALLRSARANLNLSRARLEKFARDRDRLVAMEAKELASTEAVDRVVTDYNVQQAETQAKREEVSRLVAGLADARDNLAKTVYRAPTSGLVSRLSVEQGEIVITGTMNNPGTVILTIADLSRMEVEAEVDETDVVRVKVGQAAEIEVDAIPDTTFSGTVVAVGNSGRRQGGGGANDVVNFEVKVRFDRADPRLKPGMTADIEVETEIRPDVLTVPIQALVARSRGRVEDDKKGADGDNRRRRRRSASPDTTGADEENRKEVIEGIYKLNDDVAVFVELHTGIADQKRIEVSGELAEGDEIVSGPYRILRDLKEGTRVKQSTGDDEDDG